VSVACAPATLRIIREVAARYATTAKILRGREFKNILQPAREEVVLRLKAERKLSTGQIGMIMGGRHHTTIVHYLHRDRKNIKGRSQSEGLGAGITGTSMTERINCVVDGCQRSMKNLRGYSEWLCPRHWKCTDLALREAFKKVKHTYRRARRRGWRRTDTQTRMRIMRDIAHTWRALVNDAQIKTAMGVEGTAPRVRSSHLKRGGKNEQDPLDVADAMNIAYGDGS